jgi:hypothetical protein
MTPCPFCQSEDLDVTSERQRHFVECCNCRARGPHVLRLGSDHDTADAEARAAWDERKEAARGEGA